MTPTVFMTKQPLIWHHTLWMYDITPTISAITSTISMTSHPLYLWHHTLYMTSHPLHLWHQTHSFYDITLTVSMAWNPTVFMTSHPLYMTSHLLCLWHLTHYIWHHIHYIYDITCTMSMISHPQYLSHHITSHHEQEVNSSFPALLR